MEQFILNNFRWLLTVLMWSLYWKGMALWKSARKEDKWWFIALLVINTIGLLEISYIYYFSKEKSAESNS